MIDMPSLELSFHRVSEAYSTIIEMELFTSFLEGEHTGRDCRYSARRTSKMETIVTHRYHHQDQPDMHLVPGHDDYSGVLCQQNYFRLMRTWNVRS